jgi:hypothetical protein
MAPPLEGPQFEGQGNINYSCGACGELIAKNMAKGSLANIVVKCHCGSFSEI